MDPNEIMTIAVVSIGADSEIREIARLLLERRISGIRAADEEN